MEQHGDKPQRRQDLTHGENPEPAGPPACDNPSKRYRWRLGRQFAGWGFIALGVAGLILPVLPGWIFIAWGAVTLAPDVPFFARLLDRVADRVPALRNAIERVRGQSPNCQSSGRS